MPVSKTIHVDAAGQQLHRLRCTFSSAGGATVVELEVGTHLPSACVLAQVHGYGVSGSCANYRPDVHEAAAGLSSVPAGAAMLTVGGSVSRVYVSSATTDGFPAASWAWNFTVVVAAMEIGPPRLVGEITG